MADESIDTLMTLLVIFLIRRRRRRYRCSGSRRLRKIWEKDWIRRRHEQGVYGNLLREFHAEDPECFRQFHRLDKQSFEAELAMVGPVIRKYDTYRPMRQSILPGERLAVTLRFLATGVYADIFFKIFSNPGILMHLLNL